MSFFFENRDEELCIKKFRSQRGKEIGIPPRSRPSNEALISGAESRIFKPLSSPNDFKSARMSQVAWET